jgi:hypothetical protein
VYRARDVSGVAWRQTHDSDCVIIGEARMIEMDVNATITVSLRVGDQLTCWNSCLLNGPYSSAQALVSTFSARTSASSLLANSSYGNAVNVGAVRRRC